MNIIITNSGSVPIYEQIKNKIKEKIVKGDLLEDEQLPSVRVLSKELKISILTVKKAYDELEKEGFIITRQGLGSFVASDNSNLKREEKQKEIENHLIEAIKLSERLDLSRDDFYDLVKFIYEEVCDGK